ncbi:MAG: hypothetical protein V3V59_04310 [Thermodesulfovibrionales bacterium]
MGPSNRIILVLILITGIVSSCSSGKEPTPDCDIQIGSCVKTLNNATITFDLRPKPVVPMKELRFTVSVENLNDPPERLIADLTMPGMEMGVNQVVLARTGDKTYTGKGVIVKCPKGRKLWKAKVWIPKVGEVNYLFEVE